MSCVSVAPSGLGCAGYRYPRLAAWAAFFRRFAAAAGSFMFMLSKSECKFDYFYFIAGCQEKMPVVAIPATSLSAAP